MSLLKDCTRSAPARRSATSAACAGAGATSRFALFAIAACVAPPAGSADAAVARAATGATVDGAATDTLATRTLSLQGARRVLAAAVTYAQDHGAPGAAIAIVDAGGHPVLVERLDGTFPAGADISVGKARTAVMFRRPTRGLEDTINKGRDAMIPLAAVTWFTPLQGGVPLLADGQVAGGIGVSGAASAQQDEEIALAGAAGLAAPVAATGTQRVDAREVQAAFVSGATGGTLLERAAFRVNASRRDGAGEPEVHLRDTDIFYVLEGRATVVTGGELVEPRATGPGEIRGTDLRGGTEQRLGPGDVLTIPHGVPHWFRSVKPPFRYYVVKSVTGG